MAIQPELFLVNFIPARKFHMCTCEAKRSIIHLPYCLVKYVPSWMPFTQFQRFGREGRQLSKNLCEEPFKKVKSEIVGIFSVHRDIQLSCCAPSSKALRHSHIHQSYWRQMEP